MSLHDDLILNWAFLDTVTQRSNIALWLAELEQWKTRAEAAEAALAAVPVDELRRWYGHSDVGCAVSALRYEFDQAWRDKDAIDYWLNGNDDDGVPPAAAYVGLEVQP